MELELLSFTENTTYQIIIHSIQICTHMLKGVKFNKEIMAASAMNGFTNATDAADYLVGKGVPFRDAHEIIGRLVLYCIEQDTCIDALTLEELKAISDVFEEDIYDAVSLKTCVEKRLTIGAPGIQTMQEVIQINKKFMEDSWLMQRKGDIPL